MKKTMTLNLTEKEMSILTSMAEEKGLSKTQLVRQALRLYQAVDIRMKAGETLNMYDPIAKKKTELVIIE